MGEVLLAHLPEDGEHRRLDAVGHEAHAEAAPPLYQPNISVIYQRLTDNALSALYRSGTGAQAVTAVQGR